MMKLRKDKGKPRKDKGTKRKRPLRDMASELIERIEAVENVSTDDFVYDTYPQVLAKLKDFLTRVGVNQAKENLLVNDRCAKYWVEFIMKS